MNKYIVLILSVLLIACKNDDVALTSVDNDIQAWLDTMNISAARDDSGIYYFADSLNPSGDQASNGSVIAIYYTLSDLDGNVIASRLQSSGDSLVFKLGASAVYPIGLELARIMRVGEVYNFIMPPDQAYSGLTSGAINPSLIARMQVQLVGVFNENDLFAQEIVDIDDYITANNLNDTIANPLNMVEKFPASGIASKRVRAGVGPLPLNGDTIIINYTGRFLNEVGFGSDSDFQFIFGANQPRELLSSFEFGVSRMQTNEEIVLFVPSSQGYIESALVVPNFIADDLVEDGIVPDYVVTVPPYSTLKFDITRVD
ncbi:FKBP-type peptidyl-prolyl cis-trans isomerase [Ekhidna sp.]